MTIRLTEKRMQDKRFHSTEESILISYCKVKDGLSPSRLISSARISRSTFYRHHKSIDQIAPDYESYIYRKANATINRLLKIKCLRLRTIYERLLFFISTNGIIISFLLDVGSPDFLDRIILILEPKIISITKLKNRELLLIYVDEISSLIKTWRATNFDSRLIPDLTNKIMHLTATANDRLSPLLRYDSPDISQLVISESRQNVL